jgi:hypothetical protein
VTRRDRNTLPDFNQAARDSREFAATGSGVRPLVSLRSVPWLIASYDAVRALRLDAQAGVIVSLIDGRCTVEMLLDMSPVPEDETLDIIHQLERLGVMELREPR